MITKQKSLELLHTHIKSVNLRKHCYSVGAVMYALANHFDEDGHLWEQAGLLHDLDYEENPDLHPAEGLKLLQKSNYPEEVINAVKAHAWGYREGYPKPSNNMEWSLYCCDELTGLIVACALVRPDKKLASIDLDSIQRKWKQKSFAAGVERDKIELCEKELGIKLPEFIQITLSAMQGISKDLGL